PPRAIASRTLVKRQTQPSPVVPPREEIDGGLRNASSSETARSVAAARSVLSPQILIWQCKHAVGCFSSWSQRG
ncbi:unnamed protein product, partial [Musa acuminata var. zebrina]